MEAKLKEYHIRTTMFKLIVLSVFIASGFGLPKHNGSQFNSRIVGGEDTTIEEHPYQVSVLHLDWHICGGVILNHRKILTAASCTDGKSAAFLKVRLGSSIINSGGLLRRVLKVHQHPYYKNEDYDVSILEVLHLTFTESIQPIGLHTVVPDDNSVGQVTGWGALRFGGPLSIQLQVVSLPIVNREICDEIYVVDTITDRMFCAGDPNVEKDSCARDTGGPFVVDGKVAGIVSWGIGCAWTDDWYPRVYSSVPALYEFIGAHL